MSGMIRNPDGTLAPAEPLGWQGPDDQVDWECYRLSGGRWCAKGYNRDRPAGMVVAKWKPLLMLRAWRRTGHRHMTFLWDA